MSSPRNSDPDSRPDVGGRHCYGGTDWRVTVVCLRAATDRSRRQPRPALSQQPTPPTPGLATCLTTFPISLPTFTLGLTTVSIANTPSVSVSSGRPPLAHSRLPRLAAASVDDSPSDLTERDSPLTLTERDSPHQPVTHAAIRVG